MNGHPLSFSWKSRLIILGSEIVTLPHSTKLRPRLPAKDLCPGRKPRAQRDQFSMKPCYCWFAPPLGSLHFRCHLLRHLNAYNHQIKAGSASGICGNTSKARKIQRRRKIRLILFTQRAKIFHQRDCILFRQGGRAQ